MNLHLPFILTIFLAYDASVSTHTCRLIGFRSSALYGRHSTSHRLLRSLRGGESTPSSLSAEPDIEEVSLDEKVKAAMRKLGLSPDETTGEETTTETECENGVCYPSSDSADASSLSPREVQTDVHAIAQRIASEMNVDVSLAMAAVGATSRIVPGGRQYHETEAKNLIQQELDMISQVSEESEQVKLLVDEGHDLFMSRRALAFAEMNVDDARAILLAEKEDEELENDKDNITDDDEKGHKPDSVITNTAVLETEPSRCMKTGVVDSSTDASKAPTGTVPPRQAPFSSDQPSDGQPPCPANKADVVFDATTDQIQSLVMESKVPVLIDVYASWCGPCKALTPALEDMAVKAGGIFRLVKVNSDKERAVSTALEVTALPTVFGVKDGKIVNSFQGMPRSEEFMKNFMMGLLMPGASFDPELPEGDKKKYAELSSKLVKVAGASGLSFSSRERLQDRTKSKLDEFASDAGELVDVEDSAMVLRSLLSNVIQNPYEAKFRTINLQNKIIGTKIASSPQCLSILQCAGFKPDGDQKLRMNHEVKVANVGPLLIVRDAIDKWIDKNRYELAKAARRKRDELDRAQLAAELEEEEDSLVEASDSDNEAGQNQNVCKLKLRIEGKNKIQEATVDENMPLSSVLGMLDLHLDEGEEVQLTCVSKRLVVKSSDDEAMSKSFREHNLSPAALLVFKVISSHGEDSPPRNTSSKLSDRAAQRNRKKGSHTMQSVGIYSKDDKNKGELIDGGGGTLFEHDVTDDESEEEQSPASEDS